MPDLEFLPAWYPRMLRRRRLLAISGAAALVALVAVTLALAL